MINTLYSILSDEILENILNINIVNMCNLEL